jgi:hypothetical protein
MEDRDFMEAREECRSIGTRTPVYRGMRGSMELKILGLIVCLSLVGFVWIQMRQGVTTGQARLFRYKDDKGRVAYTDNLEKVPVSQREAALNDKAIPDITTADYDTYLESFSEKKEQKGLWDSLKNMLRAEPSGTEKGGGSPVISAGAGKKDKESEDPTAKGALKGIADVPKFVNGSLSSMSQELGSGS